MHRRCVSISQVCGTPCGAALIFCLVWFIVWPSYAASNVWLIRGSCSTSTNYTRTLQKVCYLCELLSRTCSLAYAWSWVVRIHYLYRRSKSAAEHAENWFMQRGRGHMFTVWRAYCCQAEIFASSVHNARTWGWFWDAILYLYVLIVAHALRRTSPRIWEYCVNECSICIGDLSFVISRLKVVKLMR